MSESSQNKQKKVQTIRKLYELLSTYKTIVLVSLENVGSNQVQQIRKALSEKGNILVIGKNTVIAHALKLRTAPLDEKVEDYEFFKRFGEPMTQLNVLKDLIVGKIGFVFSNQTVFDLKDTLQSNRRAAVAKVGVFSPVEVVVPPGPTGMDPSQISFFHALNITTKINKGMIEIQKEIKVLKIGQKVGKSEAALLTKMNITPFSYGMEIKTMYDDGVILDNSLLNFNLSSLLEKFQTGVSNITALSLELGYVTAPAVPHMVMNAFKNLAAVALETGYKLDALEAAKNAVQTTSAPAATKQDKSAPVVQKEAEPEPVVEEDMDMGGLFD